MNDKIQRPLSADVAMHTQVSKPEHELDCKQFVDGQRVWWQCTLQCPIANGGTGRANQFSEQRQNDPDRGKPFKRAKQRARFMLEDFNNAQVREAMEQLIQLEPEKVCSVLVKIWEDAIEPKNAPKTQCRCPKGHHGCGH